MNQIQPAFKQYEVGQGIDQMKYNSIINAAMFAYKNNDAFIYKPNLSELRILLMKLFFHFNKF